MRRKHALITLAVAALVMSVAPALQPAEAAGGPNLSLGKTAAASSGNSPYTANNLNDGNQGTYWESTNNAFPQWAQIDLGSSTSVDQVVLKLPTGWGARTETLALQGSTDGSSFSTIRASAGYTFDPGSANTVTITFTATNTRYVRANITANTGWAAGQLAEFEVHGASTSTGNLASGKTMTSSSSTAPYTPNNANDGNASSYWESTNSAFPQWLQVDLGAGVAVNKIVLKLPPSTDWATRTQTLAVQSSSTGSGFTDLVASTGYVFNPAGGNTVTITFGATTTRYLRLNITANTGWPAGQISEFEVYGPGTGDPDPPTAPGNLAFTQPASGQIRLTWNASTDNVGVTAYDIYANNTLRTSVAGNVLTYTDTQPDSVTVAYYVRARDAAGNQSANSNTVTRTGTTVDPTPPTAPTNLAFTQPASGQIKLTWNASTDNVGVTGYDIYANNAVRGTVAGNVLTYTDTQPDTVTVSYSVRARDAAGNLSASSNTVTRTGTGNPGANLAVGKPIDASGSVFTFVPANANDNDVATYWEGASGAFPSTLTVHLGANAAITSIVVKLNPDAAWATRTQTIQVLGREQSASGFSQLSPATVYTFNPVSSNTVTVPVTATVADVELSITSNSGAPAGQVAEFQVIGTPAANPDLSVTGSSWTPAAPVETDTLSASATVRNAGTAGSSATNVNFYLGTTKVGTAAVGALAAGASTTVTASIGTQSAGSYQLVAKVDEANSVIELNEANNAYTNPTALVVQPVQSSDLVATATWSPGNPAAGNTVTFSATIKNQGTVASAGGAHGLTLTVLDANNTAVKTLTGSFSGTIAAGATTGPVSLGPWTAVNGRYTVRVVVAVDANELPVKQANNTTNQAFFVGRGANMPYDMYEAEDGTLGGGAQVVGPNRTIGDLAGEASGRKAVTLNTNGAFVQWTTKASTNTLVTRFSIPDGTKSTLAIYVDGQFLKNIDLTSHFAWLYGDEANPTNSPGTGPRHIYDEANVMLGTTVAAGHTIKLQKDPSNGGPFAIDFINLEQVSPVANPDPTKYLTPAGFTQQDVQNALDTARQSSTALGVYLPAGTYQTTSKFQVYGKAVKVVGAGPWYTRFQTPAAQENTDAGFTVESSANGSSFGNFAFFGNYTSRNGNGKVWGDLLNVQNLTIDNIWVEHQLCMYWGVHNTNITITNSRIRDTFADGINFTNDTTGTHIANNDARSTGDDSFALFSAIDNGGSVGNHDNVFENLSATLTWRAAGIAVYGGYNNIFRNLYVADMLTYAGVTISSLNFDIAFVGFGTTPTQLSNMSLVRAGGHFWGQQTFPAIWMFSASKEFRGIRVSDVDIIDPTYSGIMFQTKYDGTTPEFPIADTICTNVSISGAQKSGDALDAKSGFGLWANEMPEAGQGPAVGSVTFNHLTFSNNFQNIKNTTSTFTITVNP